jgi:hypothetical protein
MVVPALTNAYDHNDKSFRQFAIATLVKFGTVDRRALIFVIGLLEKERDQDLRTLVAARLGQLGHCGCPALKPLAKQLLKYSEQKTGRRPFISAVVSALCSIDTSGQFAVPLFLEILRKRKANLPALETSIHGLANYPGHSETFAVLRQLLTHSAPQIRDAAAAALKKLEPSCSERINQIFK